MSLTKVLLAKKRDNLYVTPKYEEYLALHPNIYLNDKISQFIVKELSTPQRDRRMTNSASARGSCLRRQVFVWTGLPEQQKLNSDLHAIFHDGTFRHLKWQALLLDAGILSEVEIPCRIDKYNLTGTIDGLISPEVGWELKGSNQRSYEFVLQNGPEEKHLLQIHTYMIATQIYTWSLVYENKNTQEWKEFVVEFDPDIGDRVLAELDSVNKHVSERTFPRILDECSEKKGAQYRQCPFAHICLDTHEWPNRRIRRP